MVLSRLKKTFAGKNDIQVKSYYPIVLIVEDDEEQLVLFADFVLQEIEKLLDDENISDDQKQNLRDTRVIKVGDVDSLQKAVVKFKDVILVILDCNLPDEKGGIANDQFVKENHKITGQHKPVDIIIQNLPDIPITLISSLNRFRTMVGQYYASKYGLNLKFIKKSDVTEIKKNIASHLLQRSK